ncbi:MAG: M20 family metallopeptidase [Armatimonadota bacterium]
MLNATDLCRALVRIPTAEPEPTGAAIDLCAEVLAPASFHLIDRVETAPGIESALLERPGEDPALLIDGHLDTVPAGDLSRWRYAALGGEMDSGAIWGRGSTDDKGPLAAALIALRDCPAHRRVVVSLTGDEELHMRGIRALLEHPAVQAASQAIALEPTDLVPVRAHKGNARIRIDLTGQSAHASRPWEGHNAIEEKICLITAMNEWFASGEGARRVADLDAEPSTLVVTRESTPNLTYNVIPEQTSYWYNYRPLPGAGDPFNTFIEEVRNTAERLKIKAIGEIEFSVPPFLTPADTPLVRALEHASGRSANWVAYGTHAGYLADGTREVVVFGPGSIAHAHREDEHILIHELDQGVRMLQVLFSELLG